MVAHRLAGRARQLAAPAGAAGGGEQAVRDRQTTRRERAQWRGAQDRGGDDLSGAANATTNERKVTKMRKHILVGTGAF